MTLNNFLHIKKTIPKDKQIWLINNPNYYERFVPCLKQHKSLLQKVLPHSIFRSSFQLPNSDCTLFLGFYDKGLPNLDCLNNLYTKIRKKNPYSYSLVIGKGDYEFSSKHTQNIPDNLNKIAANNVNVDHQKVHYFPMGRDFRNHQLFDKFLPTSDKKTFCYCNFSLDTHPSRKEIYQQIKNFNFIKFDHMGKFLSYSISREKFYENISKSKFTICPRGNGLDTFRLWDCLYLGVIPIVVKEAVFHNHLTDLPILFLKNIQEFRKLTKDYLENIYMEFLNKDFNYAKLDIAYWIKKFL